MAGSPVAGQAPGVVKVRLSGAVPDLAAVARLLGLADGIGVIEASQPYPNRRDPGARLYLTICLAASPAGPAQPPRRPVGPARLATWEES